MRQGAPIVLGLAGQACTGKTVTAHALAPTGQVVGSSDDEPWVRWTHLYFALPIYRVVTARQKITGDRHLDRQAYEVYDTLFQLFGGSVLFGALPPFDELVELVHHLVTSYCEPEGTKARTFMQMVGDLCREYHPGCFVDWVNRKILEEWRRDEQDRDGQDFSGHGHLGVVVSDVRFANEAEMVLGHPNGVLVRFTASSEVRDQRALARDGKPLTTNEAAHASEQLAIPEELFTATIDTDDLTIAQQAARTQAVVDEVVFGRHPETTLSRLLKGLQNTHAETQH